MSAQRLPINVPRNIRQAPAEAPRGSAAYREAVQTRRGGDRRDIVDAFQELGDSEHAERERDDLDAVIEMAEPKGESLCPVFTSLPTSANSNPSNVIKTPLSGEPRASVDPASNPNSISEQMSAAPNLKAMLTSNGGERISFPLCRTRPRRTKRASLCRAQRPRPFFASSGSRQTGDGMRGMAGKIQQDRTDRPHMRAVEMPASIRMAATGCMAKVAAAESRSSPAPPGPAIPRPDCRSARRRSTRSGYPAAAPRRSRT